MHTLRPRPFPAFAPRIDDKLSKFPDAVDNFRVPLPPECHEHAVFEASVAVAPFGPGEMRASDLTVEDRDLIFVVSDGQPWRQYILKLVAKINREPGLPVSRPLDGGGAIPGTRLGPRMVFSERTVVWEVFAYVRPLLPTDAPTPAPFPAFGPETVWRRGPSLDFRYPRNAGIRLLGWI